MLPSTRCPHCKHKLSDGDGRIHSDCIAPWYEANREKLRAKARKVDRAEKRVERAQDREKREKLKRLPELIAAAQKEFNAFIRERDRDQPCICCGRRSSDKDLLTGSRWDCGHYRSTGSASHLRFDERNAHRQLVLCNRHGGGRAVDYRIGLIARIGIAAVEALEASNEPHKWTREELIEIKLRFRARRKELEKQR